MIDGSEYATKTELVTVQSPEVHRQRHDMFWMPCHLQQHGYSIPRGHLLEAKFGGFGW